MSVPEAGIRVSVVMCTRDRADQLRRVLDSAVAMAVPSGLAWEFVLVDNGSTDHTPAVVEAFKGSLPIRRVEEPKAGLSNARNRGVAEARGDHILWTDDDVVIDAGWLAAYVEAIEAHPEAAFFGGRIEPVLEGTLPGWWADNREALSGLLAERDLGPVTRPMTGQDGDLPYGASFAVRAADQRRHPYDPALGVGPGVARLSEETAVLAAMVAEGLGGVWVPGARVKHVIPARRLTLAYVGTYFRSMGETWEYVARTGRHPSLMPSLPQVAISGRRLLGAPAWFWKAAGRSWLAYRAARLRGPSAVWLQHWIEYNIFLGRIRYWRRLAPADSQSTISRVRGA